MQAPLLIADSGPLIALARLDLLGLPLHYFDAVMVTATVWAEVMRKPQGNEGLRLEQALVRGSFRLVEDVDSDAQDLFWADAGGGIDAGERTVLAQAARLGAAVLMDDFRARRAAFKLALPVIGTLGILVRARDDGLIGPLRPVLDALSASGYFLPGTVVDKILAERGE